MTCSWLTRIQRYPRRVEHLQGSVRIASLASRTLHKSGHFLLEARAAWPRSADAQLAVRLASRAIHATREGAASGFGTAFIDVEPFRHFATNLAHVTMAAEVREDAQRHVQRVDLRIHRVSSHALTGQLAASAEKAVEATTRVLEAAAAAGGVRAHCNELRESPTKRKPCRPGNEIIGRAASRVTRR